MALPTIAEFESVIRNLMSPDNTIRGQAEAYFNSAKSQPDFLVSSLVQLMRNSPADEIRALCVILLRKCVSKAENLWATASVTTQTLVKTELLAAVEKEQSKAIRNKLPYCIASLASELVEQGQWPELLPFMFRCTKSGIPHLRECALSIFNQLATFLLDNGLAPYLGPLCEVFKECLSDPSSKIQLAALQATSSVITCLEQDSNIGVFAPLLPQMIQTIGNCLTSQDTESASSVLESLIEVAESQPSFFKKNLSDVLNVMIQIASNASIDENVRHLAVEFTTSISESLPKLVRKVPNFVSNVFNLAVQLMVTVEDDSDWATAPDNEEDTDLTDFDVGLDALDRVAIALGGTVVLPVCFSILPPLMSSAGWQQKHAALMTLAMISEGTAKQLLPHIPEVLKMVLHHLRDPHPRVRWAAVHCLAQFSTDFSGHFQATYHAQVAPALASALEDPVQRVKSHAAASIVNFCEDCPSDYVNPHLDLFLSKLVVLVQSGVATVQEQSLATIATVAEAAASGFAKYYDAIVPGLKMILTSATDKTQRMLRARAMECISLIGCAVGKEKFGPDVMPVMEILCKTQSSTMDPDDPQTQFLLQAYTRIAKCLGRDFVPFLSLVIPPLLASAESKADVSITDADELTQQEEGVESVTVSIKGVGEKRISIRTSALEEKSLACNMLHSFLVDLGVEMMPYLERISTITVPLLRFPYMEDIRETSALIMNNLLKCTKAHITEKGGEPGLLKRLLDFILPELVGAIKVETDQAVAITMIDALADCINTCGPAHLASEQVADIVTMLETEIKECIERRRELHKTQEEADDEEEHERVEEQKDMEADFLSRATDVMSALLKTHIEIYLPLFLKGLWPAFQTLLDPKIAAAERRVAICVVDDFIEFGSGNAAPYIPPLIPALLTYSKDSAAEVRQAAVYGLGACAQFAGATFAPAAASAAQVLCEVVSLPDAKSEDNASVTTNAASALFKICQFQSSAPGVDTNTLLSIWLSSLPALEDEIEACIVHSKLVELIKANNPVILGSNHANVPKIISIFAEILHSELASQETQTEIVAILRQMQTALPQTVLAAAWSGLSAEQQGKLTKAISA